VCVCVVCVCVYRLHGAKTRRNVYGVFEKLMAREEEEVHWQKELLARPSNHVTKEAWMYMDSQEEIVLLLLNKNIVNDLKRKKP